MVKTLDFFPPHAVKTVDLKDQQSLGIDFGTSFLITDLPLRYIFQYALNHLRENLSAQGNHPSPSSVLIVTRSKAELQTRMYHEQRRSYRTGEQAGHRGSSTASTATTGRGIWQHLFPPNRDQQQTQPGASASLATTTTTLEAASGTDLFESELWSRIEMRYAPTLGHVQALFRGLHLEPEETNGVTSFGPSPSSASTSASTSAGQAAATVKSRCFPSLVILIGCFSMDDSAAATTFSGAGPKTVGVAIDEREQQGTQDPARAMTSAASKTLSEIKDSLDWIAQKSGRNVDLAVFEDTTTIANKDDGYDNATRFPSPRELWLQRTVGYWVKAIINVQRTRTLRTTTNSSSGIGDSLQEKNNDQDSFTMWIKTHESLRRLLDTSSAEGGGGGVSEQLASMGALAAVEWSFDHERNQIRFA